MRAYFGKYCIGFLPKGRHGTAIGGALAMLIIDLAIGIMYTSRVAEANDYHYKNIAEIKKQMSFQGELL